MTKILSTSRSIFRVLWNLTCFWVKRPTVSSVAIWKELHTLNIIAFVILPCRKHLSLSYATYTYTHYIVTCNLEIYYTQDQWCDGDHTPSEPPADMLTSTAPRQKKAAISATPVTPYFRRVIWRINRFACTISCRVVTFTIRVRAII